VSITTAPRSIERPTILRHLVLAALLAITSVNYIQRNAISPAATTIEEQLGVTGRQLDFATGAFFLAYTLLQVPSGWLAQRWGPRLTLSLYASGWSLALVLCALASGFIELFVGRLAMGALQAGIFPCATLILQVWYPVTQRGLATALLNSFMLLGSAVGVWLGGQLLEPLGWRGVFLAYAMPGLLWALWFVWWFRNHPAEHPGVNEAERDLLAANRPAPAVPAAPASVPAVPDTNVKASSPAYTENSPTPSITLEARVEDTEDKSSPAGYADRPVVRTWVLVLTSVPLLLLCLQQGCRAAASRLFDSRLPTYLERERGQTKKQAAAMSSYPMWAAIFGGIAGGTLSDVILRRTGKRRLARNGIALFSLFVSTLVYFAAWFVADLTLAILVLSAGYFIFSFSSPCSYALCIDIGGKHLAVVFGLMNMIGNLGATAFVSTVTTLVSLGGWELALGVWLMLPVIAFICWLFINPNVVIGEPAPSPRPE
jgi:ACS family glucarate transporter-like MFS transporter